MSNLNENKICFIICTNNDQFLSECLTYLSLLEVPEGMETELLTITEARSMTSGYNEGMNASDAKYKVYLHQDTFITNPNFISDLISVFQSDEKIGLVGMIGAEKLSQDGVMWHGQRCGDFYRLDELIASGITSIEKLESGVREVQVVDGLLIATQYDIPWREDILKGWDFYDVSQCLEFRRAGYKVVVPAQNPSWTNHKCGAPSFWKYDSNRRIVLEEYPEIRGDKTQYRILFAGCSMIALNGLAVGLTMAGHDVQIWSKRPPMTWVDERFVEALEEALEEGNYDLVVSYDFVPTLAEGCHNSNVKYLAWVYDSPQFELYRKEGLYDTNHVMLFDRKQLERMRKVGLKHLYYNTLATDFEIFGSLKLEKGDEKQYAADVSFVGRLYNKRDFATLFEGADHKYREEAEAILNACKCKWDKDTTIFGRASKELLMFLHEKDAADDWLAEIFTDGFYEESFILTRMLNEMERVAVLNAAAEKYRVALYTDDERVNGLVNVEVRPPVSYLGEMPKAFYYSKINLNISSRCIESGIPQRIFDIMAVGGFVLTSYQPEIEEYFEIGKEIEVYHNLEELIQKIDYYMKHEEQRLRIALNGYKKVKKSYSYTVKADEMVRRVMEEG